MAPKVTVKEPGVNGEVIRVKTKPDSQNGKIGKWWNSSTRDELAQSLIATATYLRDQQQYRYRQAGINARLYGNVNLFDMAGMQVNRMETNKSMPADRPTMNVVQSCIDTLVSRITQSRPRPVFLTDNGDYKQRNLAKQMNQFIQGEFYQTKAYQKGVVALKDGAILGTGCEKFFEDENKRMASERVMMTELLVDPADARMGSPRQLYQLKLIDREVAEEMFPKYRSIVSNAQPAFADNSSSSQLTIADQVMFVESWHLKSGPNATDGEHAIACNGGLVYSEKWEENYFPFTFMHYSPRILGFWAQSLAEQLMGTQIEINKLLMTISQSINLVGVPRVFLEEGSKVVSAHLNNQVGAIIKFRGTKPIYEVAPCVPQEIYGQLQRLVEYAYQQSGVSALAATSQKPAGLNSGEAIRNYDDLQSDRFAELNKRYDDYYIEKAYQLINGARKICERDGSYQTVYPDQKGAKQIDLPASKLLEDPFVIQCYDASSLPKDPAGRLQTITEMTQAGMISLSESRRLLDYPDLAQVDQLATAAEERILQALDQMVEDGKYTPPDAQMELDQAKTIALQYYNLYAPKKLEDSRLELIRNFIASIDDLNEQAQMAAQQQQMQAQQAQMAQQPQGVPEARPTSALLPQVQ